MNYSIVPVEELVEEDFSRGERKEIELKGAIMEVEFTSANYGKIVRIISSNPRDYLKYQPGTEVEFIPQTN